MTSEHGERVHYGPACHGSRNAATRRRQLSLCATTVRETASPFFRLDG